jgi:fructose-1,6-bisphosphatase I
MALLMEAAGGKATTGTMRVLDVVPKSIHERVPIFLGSTDNIEELESFFKADEEKKKAQPTN